MKYKIGDRVKVREDLEIYNDEDYEYDGSGIIAINGMKKYRGLIVKIKGYYYDEGYLIEEDNEQYAWTDEMFEDIDNEWDYKKLLKNNDNTFKLFSAIVKNADYEYQKIVKINPTALHYENEGEQPYIKYVCPICQSLGIRLQLAKGKSNCTTCNVNLNWEE